jgi:histidinol phosphatase-like enzyme (inositol monophosphatase family)
MNPDTADHSALLEFAVSVADAAGRHTLTHFRDIELSVDHKSDGSPVTVADRETESLIIERIRDAFPDDAILGEEHGELPGTSGRRWIIDPIDGTDAFTHGVSLYCSLLALEDESGPVLGTINIPALGELVAAARGVGCHFNGVRCHVDDRSTVEGSVLTTSAYDHWDHDMLTRARDSGMKMRTWGDGYGYALLATGRAQAMVDPVLAYWDVAPLRVIVPEAGGTITTLDGDPVTGAGSALATNGALHHDVLTMLNGARR